MPECAKCKKRREGTQMRKCCDGTYYCNRKCERANFRNHKTSCTKPIVEVIKPVPPPDPALLKDIVMPFQRLLRGDYLQGRPDTDVYKLLIDAYRLRMHYKYNHEHSTYGGVGHGIQGFRHFLGRAQAIPHMLPSWWSDKKQAECEELGCQEGWSSLAETIDDVAVCHHYNGTQKDAQNNTHIEIQLLFLAEDIYGTGIGNTPDRFLRRLMMFYDASIIIAMKALREALTEALDRALIETL
ncbi:hypothetical protein GGS24DRAFT_503910 [Hypoxylon argillaceum]|nr:hypothetical protein GGS24DRAFT_503910 [Hypoxylon argillaceum]